MNCPKCHSSLAKPNYCEDCGWIRREAKDKPQRQGGIERCAWIANGEQCHYPGTNWSNTHGIGQGYCRFHIQQDCTAAFGAQVVEQSRTEPYLKRSHLSACQSTLCPVTTRAVPGRDLCSACQCIEDGGQVVPRIKFPVRRVSEYVRVKA